MTNHVLSRLEKCKIYFEIIGMLVVFFGGGWSVFKHLDLSEKDKSDKLYNDLIIGGTIKYIKELGKILDYQIGPETEQSFNRENTLYRALAEIQELKHLNKPKNKTKKVKVEPLSELESRELEKRYATVDEIMSMKMFFLGDEICKAIRASARLISEERPHFQSNLFSRNGIDKLKKEKEISLFDAYRYWVLVERNYNFLKEVLITVSDYVLEQNYTSYKEYKSIQKLAKSEVNENSEEILIAIHNLIELRERYYRYEDSEKPEYSITDKGKKLCVDQLIQFFEKYNKKRRAGEKPYVPTIPDSKICTVFVKKKRIVIE